MDEGKLKSHEHAILQTKLAGGEGTYVKLMKGENRRGRGDLQMYLDLRKEDE
jgi:hypothetical protein